TRYVLFCLLPCPARVVLPRALLRVSDGSIRPQYKSSWLTRTAAFQPFVCRHPLVCGLNCRCHILIRSNDLALPSIKQGWYFMCIRKHQAVMSLPTMPPGLL